MSAPPTRTTTLEEGIHHIGAEPTVWVRVAAIRREDGDTWRARLLELTSGAVPPSWQARAWNYPWALLSGTTQSGDAVVEWLRAGQIALGGHDISLPQMTTSLTWERRQSRSAGPYESLEWPATETTLAHIDGSQGEPPGHLVSAEDAPSFINFYAAAACFFWLDRQPVGGSLYQGVLYRHQDARGRVNAVRVLDEEVEIEIEGGAIGGMTVELAGAQPGPSHRLPDRPGPSVETVRFPIKDGLPPGAWVLLRSGDEWIDRRFLTVPWTHGTEAGVEVVVEPRTKLEAFLANREGPMAEFKRQIPSEDDGKAKVMKTVCAFANGEGGSLLFGIDDDHNLVGVPAQAVDRLKDQLTQLVGSWVDPRPIIDFETLPVDETDRVVLELCVEPGVGLYGSARPGGIPTPYIRHYATTVRARPAEIETIVRSRTPSGGSIPPWATR